MTFTNIEKSLGEISESLEDVNLRREKLLKESRDIISLSSKAIINMHTRDFKDAKKNLDSVKNVLFNLQKTSQEDLTRYLIQPEGEYVEAMVLYAIINKKPIPSRKTLNVSGHAYLFGLSDAIGETKRLVYDKIRNGKSQEAANLFEIMEKLFVLLSPFAAYDNITGGIRRKLDIARKLIEDVRGLITEEIRREDYIKAMESFSRKIKT